MPMNGDDDDHAPPSRTVAIEVAGRRFEIEYAWLGPSAPNPLPPLVFLHEGLGSVSMWRGFPQRVCVALGRRGLVYSRPGYGRSTARAIDERWGPDQMQFQADAVLPALLSALGFNHGRCLLFGHSDGGSIALIHAALHPSGIEGVVALAPHIMVEDVSLSSIEAARSAYLEGDLRKRLRRHHADVDSAFYGWCDMWLSPAFRTWTLEPLLGRITAPVLALQGLADEYGTLAQIQGIGRGVAQAQWLALADCGHSPHRDQPTAVLEAVQVWLRANAGRR